MRLLFFLGRSADDDDDDDDDDGSMVYKSYDSACPMIMRDCVVLNFYDFYL